MAHEEMEKRKAVYFITEQACSLTLVQGATDTDEFRACREAMEYLADGDEALVGEFLSRTGIRGGDPGGLAMDDVDEYFPMLFDLCAAIIELAKRARDTDTPKNMRDTLLKTVVLISGIHREDSIMETILSEAGADIETANRKAAFFLTEQALRLAKASGEAVTDEYIACHEAVIYLAEGDEAIVAEFLSRLNKPKNNPSDIAEFGSDLYSPMMFDLCAAIIELAKRARSKDTPEWMRDTLLNTAGFISGIHCEDSIMEAMLNDARDEIG
jgi:hypothetical protein